VPARRSKSPLLALALLASCLLPTGAAAFPIGSASLPRTVAAGSPITAVVREHVGSSGVYDLDVTVATRATERRFLDVEIGPLARRARVDRWADSAKLRLLLAIDRPSFTVRVRNARLGTVVRTSLVRLGALAPGATAGVIAPAAEPAGKGSTRPTGPVTKAGAAGPTGSSGASGSTGSTGSVGVSAPVAVPAPVQAPLVASFAPDGAPILALPNGFTPIVNYSNLVKDYEFNGSSLPADWAASANDSHGVHATMYQPSQVTMTGSSVALTAVPQASDGYPYTSGYISTQGQYSFNYGLIDYSARMPGGPGLWSGLWLDQPDGSNPWGELDVQEMLLNDLHTVYGSAHGWAPSDWGETQSTVMSADATAGYHDYQLAWQPGLLTWAVDGIAYAQYSETQAIAHGYPWVFDDGTGFYIIASLTVGAADEWAGAPNASTPWPATMQVKSIKLWQ
jgi:hypothetical protein